MPNWRRRPWHRDAPFAGGYCIRRTIPESPVASRIFIGRPFHPVSASVVPSVDAEAPASPCAFLDARSMSAWWWFLPPVAGDVSMPGSPGYRPTRACLCVPCSAGVHSGARPSLPPRSGGRSVGVSCHPPIHKHSRCHCTGLLKDRARNQRWPVCAFCGRSPSVP